MDEIYPKARWTVLLLKGGDLMTLQQTEKLLGCDIDHDNHSYLLTQTCASLELDQQLESRVFTALRRSTAVRCGERLKPASADGSGGSAGSISSSDDQGPPLPY